MSQGRERQKVKHQIAEGVKDFEFHSVKRKSSFSKLELEKSQIQLTPRQTELYKGIRNNTLTVAHGPAGTSKTFTTCYTALALLADKKIEKIIITKPAQESGENLGALPGTIEEKIDPYKQSYYTTFCKIIGKAQTEFLFSTEEIVFEPLAYMRGSTYDNCVMLLDECQNATIKQLMLWSTRLGQDSKAIMMGDVSQYDLKKRDSGYQTFIRMVGGETPMESLFLFEFKNEDIVRNKFLIELTKRYDKWRSDNND